MTVKELTKRLRDMGMNRCDANDCADLFAWGMMDAETVLRHAAASLAEDEEVR